MPVLRIYKEVGILPATLVPNAAYAVRTGVGFDLYISDSTGTVAHKVNGATTAVMPDGSTTLSWVDGYLVGILYPDGGTTTLVWANALLQSASTTRNGITKTRTFTWLGDVLQSFNTTTV